MMKRLFVLSVLGLGVLQTPGMAAGILDGIPQLTYGGSNIVNCGSYDSTLLQDRMIKCQSCLTSAETALRAAGFIIFTTTSCYISPLTPGIPSVVSGYLSFGR